MRTHLIAPCGMDCKICIGHIREKNTCPGCRGDTASILTGCAKCIIRNCDYFKTTDKKYCFSCPKYPCTRLKQLDKRYTNKYNMSMLENLEYIKQYGVRKFAKKEEKKWKCSKCGEMLSCHRHTCEACGTKVKF
jgi:hypothetical protein